MSVEFSVEAQAYVKVDLKKVIEGWIEEFVSKLPMPDGIDDIFIDPKTRKASASWNFGTEENPFVEIGSISASCKDVVVYEMVKNLLYVLSMSDSDSKFLVESGIIDEETEK